VVPLAIAAVVASIVLPAGRHQWAESLVRQRSTYTALAFVNPTALPLEISSGQQVSFAFSVANEESSGIRYRYLVTSSPTKQIIGGGSLRIPTGGTGVVHMSVLPRCASSPCRISIDLVDYSESVGFNVRVTGLSAKGT
jgi:hypothetical protein